MNRPVEFATLCFLTYLLGAFLTFGWAYHDTCKADFASGFCAAFSGFAWPVYWGGYVAIELFEPAEQRP